MLFERLINSKLYKNSKVLQNLIYTKNAEKHVLTWFSGVRVAQDHVIHGKNGVWNAKTLAIIGKNPM